MLHRCPKPASGARVSVVPDGAGSHFGKDKKEEKEIWRKTGEIISTDNASDMQEEIAPRASPL